MVFRVRWARVLVAISLVAVIGWSSLPAGAQENPRSAEQLRRQIEQYQQRLDRIRRQQQQTQRQLRQVQRQQRTLEAEIARLNRHLAATRQELAETEAQLEAAEARLEQARAELRVVEGQLAYRTDLLERRVRAIAEHGTVAYLDVLFSARDFRDFLTRFELLRQIVAQDVELLQEVRQKRQQVEAKKEQIEQERARIVAIRMELLKKKQEIEVVTAERRGLYERLEQDEAEYRAQLAEQERSSRQVEQLLRQASAELSRLLPGKVGAFVWPVDRTGYWRISSQFGRRWHPVLREYRVHQGIDIAKPHGANVYAAAAGRVVYAGWLGGYGNTVVIAHSGSLSTLYGHTSQVLVRVGDTVSAGQVIAKVGSTGLSTGPHVHFEVRKDGKPVNPMSYLP